MLDTIGNFFSQFQPKDWITTGIAAAAFIVSAWTASRRHWFDKVKHLEQQADFTVKWLNHHDRGAFFLQVTNEGKGDAFHVRVSSPDDPTQILGLTETAQGPLKTDQYLLQPFHGTDLQVARGVRPANDGPSWVFHVDWVDVYGEPRRQVIQHVDHQAGKIDDLLWSELHSNPSFYSRGPIGSSAYQDLQVLPKLKKRWLRRKWVDRHVS